MKLSEIAGEIKSHLKRIESNPKLNRRNNDSKLLSYWGTSAWASGRFVYVTYVSYQGASYLTKDQALKYLTWLNSGNVGRHWSAIK